MLALPSTALGLALAQAVESAPAAAAQVASSPELPGAAALAGPAAVLLLLAAAALLLSRRRRAPTRRIQVLETASLGPKRSLVLARLGGELLLLGTTEGSITLLRAQPAGAPAPIPEHAEEPQPVRFEEASPAPAPRAAAPLLDLASRLVRRRPAPDPRSPAFDALLAESAEDQELRQKLSRGLGGSVR